MSVAIVRYRAGRPIDTSKTLEINSLRAGLWGPIEEAYPIIGQAGPSAGFRHESLVTIYPPTIVRNARQLAQMSRRLYDNADGHYELREGDQLKVFMAYVHDGYAVLHIYQLGE